MSSHLDYFEVFPWNKNFETGHPEIDQQHRKITELLNKLANTLTRDEQIEVTEAFSELAEYADFHFRAEEQIWDSYLKNDPLLTKHKDTHHSFLPTVIALKDKDKDKPLKDIIEDIIRFLIRWLAYHIIDDDKRLAIIVSHLEQGKSQEEARALAQEAMSGATEILIETVLSMYDRISSRTLDLMRERHARLKAEEDLKKANKRLEELSITDQLTGLYNRRHFENIFKRELQRAHRDKCALTYILFDLDFFKKLNDFYGHVAGDEALQKVGTLLQEICKRPGDFAFRVGGEEFAVLSMGEQTNNEPQFGEIIRQEIEKLAIPHEKSLIADVLTTSIGMVSKIPDDNDTVEWFMKTADIHLYEAKEQGRNRVVGS